MCLQKHGVRTGKLQIKLTNSSFHWTRNKYLFCMRLRTCCLSCHSLGTSWFEDLQHEFRNCFQDMQSGQFSNKCSIGLFHRELMCSSWKPRSGCICKSRWHFLSQKLYVCTKGRVAISPKISPFQHSRRLVQGKYHSLLLVQCWSRRKVQNLIYRYKHKSDLPAGLNRSFG